MNNVKVDTRALDNLIRKSPGAADAAASQIAFTVEGMAKRLAPHDTYALRQSINTEKVENARYHVQDGVRYGIYQELGFHHFASGAFIQNAFMVPSVEGQRSKFVPALVREIFK